MKVQSCIRYAIVCMMMFFHASFFSDSCSQKKIALHRGFQYPEYSNTYAAVQLFSSSDIGRSMYCVKKPISMVLSRPADFEPDCELNSSSMLKIKSSGTSIDFNGFEIKKVSTDKSDNALAWGVGIEVGYSPAELAADSTLQQVQNVVIKNGGLNNFEIGIVVHAGVKNVIIENFYLSHAPLGILLLGQDEQQVASCMLKNVRVTGDFQDNALILQWAKVKIEETSVASIDSANGGTTLLKGKAGSPAPGYGYGTDYCFQALQHNPVSNMNDAYTYYGIFIKSGVNIMLDNVLVKCMGYQGDRHEVVAPGTTVGTVTNPSTSSVSINGDVVAGEVTSTVTKGISIVDSSTIFIKATEAVNCVSALIAWGIFVQGSSSVSIKHSACSSNDAHHITGAATPQSITDADIKSNTTIVDPNTGATFNSLYTTLAFDVSLLPASVPPLLDAIIEPYRDALIEYEAIITAGVSLSELLYHVEQMVLNAQALIAAYELLGAPTADDTLAHTQAQAIVTSGSALFDFAYHAIYQSGRSCFGLYLDQSTVVEMLDVMANYNKAEHFVVGLWAGEGDVLSVTDGAFNNNSADNEGDDSITPIPEVANAHAHGMVFFNSDTIDLERITVQYNQAYGLARGMYGYEVTAYKVAGCASSHMLSSHPTLEQGIATGHCLFGAHSCTTCSLRADDNQGKRLTHGIHLACVTSFDGTGIEADTNYSELTDVVGLYIDRSHSFNVQDISTSSNRGEEKAWGMVCESSSAVQITGAIANDNYVNRSNSLATNCFGMWWHNPEACFLQKISCSNNRGRTLGIGLWAETTKTFHIEEGDFCLNSATAYQDGETTEPNDATNASKFFPNDYVSGALGLYFKTSCDVTLKEVVASKNNAHRAAGIFALSSSDFVLEDCVTSFQAGTGNYFIDNPFDGIQFCEFPIPTNHYDTLFGSPELEDPLNPPNIIAADQVNLLQAICCFLTSIAMIPSLPDSIFAIKNNIICNKSGSIVDMCSQDDSNDSPQNKFVGSWLLIQAAMAYYRLFGTAVGLQLHDCDGFTVKHHFANGNTSLQDNAAGIATTGMSTNHTFDGGRAINNDGWTESALGAVTADRYDLAAVKPFYDALYATTGDVLTADFDIGGGSQLMPKNFVQDIVDKKILEYFTINIDCACPGGSGTSIDYWLTNPVGGMGVGILLGDCSAHSEVHGYDCANNKGASGFACGLLQDVSANNALEDNRLYQNAVNLLGICFGVADITTQTTSIMMRNFMFCNRIGDYLNFNFFVPYNVGASFGQMFPLITGFIGDFAPFVAAGAYDNIEICFLKTAPQNLCVPDYIGTRDPTMPDMLSLWEDAGYLLSS